MRKGRSITLALLAICTLSCSSHIAVLDRVLATGSLKVAMLPSPTTITLGSKGPSGFEFRLAERFAEELGVNLEPVLVGTASELYTALLQGRADLAASHLVATSAGSRPWVYSRSYLNSQAVLIGHGNRRPPASMDELAGERIVLPAGSKAGALLRELAPGVQWQQSEQNLEQVLAAIERGDVDFTISGQREFSAHQALLPDVAALMPLGGPRRVAWALPSHRDPGLHEAVDRFLQRSQHGGVIERLSNRHLRFPEQSSRFDREVFKRHIGERLPPLLAHFQSAAGAADLDWELIAAVAYQESHWNTRARSPTGVEGMMMLTRQTARHLGVAQRLDAEQSIHGGALYLRQLYDRLPQRIPGPERLAFALAAYNIGLGHLEDARVLTQRAGRNPDRWEDVEQSLPKLADARVAASTRHGRARGGQAVLFVRAVRRYAQDLRWAHTRQQLAVASQTQNLPVSRRL